MATTLEEHQFEILPTAEASSGFVFGIGAEVSLNEDGFDPGENEWITQDGQNARRGVTGFGRDVLAGKTWSWQSHVDRDTEEEAADTLDRFSAAWMPELLARDPGAITSIRYQFAGRTRRIFGRPRRYGAPPSNMVLSGYVPISHDFTTVDAFTYDDVMSSALIPYLSDAVGGGFTFPAAFPVETLPSEGTGQDQVQVLGRARAYPLLRFNGPWTNPRLETDDWSVSWTGSIPSGKWVEIDTRPWKLTVMNSDGGSVVEGLNPRTYLEDLWFEPQSQPQIRLGGTSASGNASALVRWRNTWTSI